MGVTIGDEFISEAEARQEIIDFIRRTVGPRKHPNTGKPMKPDLLFAITVIKRTIPPNVLRSEKRAEYERMLDTLFRIRDELSQMETTIGMFWTVEDVEKPTPENEDE